MPLSTNTQAALLLTAPLLVGRKDPDAPKPLAPTQFRKLVQLLDSRDLSPADLLGQSADALIEECQSELNLPLLGALLHRGFLLSQATEHWNQRSIWVTSRSDPDYPQRLIQTLADNAPLLMHGCGDAKLLDRGGLAIVGSRNTTEEVLAFANTTAQLAARAGVSVVSGGARGVDQAAMQGAGESGGCVVGVLADSLERAALRREHREALQDGTLVLCSPYDPMAGFNAGHAMQRNKLIFALADAGLVVNADFQKGGTWNGAVEQLEKLHFVPIFVRDDTAPDNPPGSSPSKAHQALIEKGATLWPNPTEPDELKAAIATSPNTAQHPAQGNLFAE